jgi:hypothetical protein
MRRIIGTFLFILCCLASTDAMPHTIQAREVHAVIQAIDLEKKVLTLNYDQAHGPQKMVWNEDTQFLHDEKPGSATELNEGTHVTLFYHSPFFGKPFATKVIWNKTD